MVSSLLYFICMKYYGIYSPLQLFSNILTSATGRGTDRNSAALYLHGLWSLPLSNPTLIDFLLLFTHLCKMTFLISKNQFNMSSSDIYCKVTLCSG